MVEAIKRPSLRDILLTTDGPALLSAVTDTSQRLRQFDLERYDPDTKRMRRPQAIPVSSDLHPPLGTSPLGQWGAAASGDTSAAVFQAGTAFGLALLDLRNLRVRLVKIIDIDLPPHGEPFVHTRVAAGPDRFGIAIARADALAWVEFDVHGKMLDTPLYWKTVSQPDPVAVWNGSSFGFITRRQLEGKEWVGVAEVQKSGPPRFLGAVVDDRAVRSYYPEGRLVWNDGAYIFGARSFGMEPTPTGAARFDLYRVESSGRVDRRECPDYD